MSHRRRKITLIAAMTGILIGTGSFAQDRLTPPQRSYAIRETIQIASETDLTIERTQSIEWTQSNERAHSNEQAQQPNEQVPFIELAAPIQVAALPASLVPIDSSDVFESPVRGAPPADSVAVTGDDIVRMEIPTPLDGVQVDACDGCIELNSAGPLSSTLAYPSAETRCSKCVSRPSRPVAVRPGDQVWLISTRHTACRSTDDLCMHRFVCGVGFVPALVEEYFAAVGPADDGLILDNAPGSGNASNNRLPLRSQHSTVTMYVHGNRVDTQTACDRGFSIYEALASNANADQKLCHVIWSWPSDIIPGVFLIDARQKAYKTHWQSYLLADFVSRHSPASRIGLIGFSYGGRIILGSQHLMGGGETFGRRLHPEQVHATPRTRVAIWAPALPMSWITPVGLYGQAVMSVDRMLMYYNSRDPALRFYRKKLAESDTEALGFRGIDLVSLGQAAPWVEQYNAAGIIGAHHSWTKYAGAVEIVRRTADCVLWHDAIR